MAEQMLQETTVESEEWTLGPSNAAVTILEYGDFQCSYCGTAAEELNELITEGSGKFRLIFRHFPLTSIHRRAVLAAQAAEAAGAQGKFWEMHHLLFANQESLDPEDLGRYAAALGLDVARFERELKEKTYLGEVKGDIRRGLRDGVSGTPTIFLNGVRYDGPRDRTAIVAASRRPSRRQVSARRHA